MKTKIDKDQLKQMVLNGITTEELNSKYDYSDITNMSYMFSNCSSLKSIPQLDTSNVTDMSFMFYNCSNLKTIPIDLFNKLNLDISEYPNLEPELLI